MQLTIPRQDLTRLMTSVGKVVESRNTIPILSHVLLTATDGRLTAAGTDLDILATASAEAEVTAPGAVCVDAKLLADIAKKAGADVSMSLEGDKLIVKSGRSRFTLATLSATDWPALKAGTYEAEFELDIAALFAPVAFAQSTEQTRYYLCGVFFRGADGVVTAVATDGHRLGRHVISSDVDFNGVIVPTKLVSMLPKGSVKVSVSQQNIKLETADFSLVSKLIDGTYPDFERVIPKSNELLVTVDRSALLKAADRVSSVSSERGRAVKLSVAVGLVSLSVSSAVGSASDEIETTYDGEPVEIGFNSAYLKDVLTALADGPVTLALRDAGSAALLTGAQVGLDITLMPTRV